jgi:hypothetical protein
MAAGECGPNAGVRLYIAALSGLGLLHDDIGSVGFVAEFAIDGFPAGASSATCRASTRC